MATYPSRNNNYNFKLVTTEASIDSNPGDRKTNQIYTETVRRIERLLSRRGSNGEKDFRRVVITQEKGDLISNECVHVHFPKEFSRLATDQELQISVLGPDSNPTPVHSVEYLERMKKNSETAASRVEAWKAKHYRQQRSHKPKRERLSPLLNVGDSACVDGRTTEAAARTSAAALIDVAKEAWSSRNYNCAFVLTKPPSHHAVGNTIFSRYPDEMRAGKENENSPLGFCHINSIATAVAHLLNMPEGPANKVCVLDFDVHHGNGNEDTFWYDPRVLTISLHQEDLWPGPENGLAEYTGDEKCAPDSNLNVPLPPQSGDVPYARAMDEIVFPRMKMFKPEAIFVAAGFDAMKGDKYADQEVTAEWYGWCVQELRNRFPEVLLVLNLEGGYKPSNVETGIGRCIDALLPEVKYCFGLEDAQDVEKGGRKNSAASRGGNSLSKDALYELKARPRERRNVIAFKAESPSAQNKLDPTAVELQNSLANLKIS